MSRLLEACKDIAEAEHNIAIEIAKKESAQKQIKELLGENNTSFPTPLKKFINQKLYDNISEENKKNIQNRKEREELMAKMNSVVYAVDSTFDPEKDSYIIDSIIYNEDKTKIQIKVECLKSRKYLGINGAWIPSYFYTDWIDIEEIKKYERHE